MPRWRFLVVVMALVAYALASHGLMVYAAERAWAVAALLVGVVYRGGVADVTRLYLLQYVAIHAVLAWSFGITLRSGSTPIITLFAEQVHGTISPGMRAYTRRLTAVWVAYFCTMAVISLILFSTAPWSWWSVFANLVTPLAVVTLFVGEYLMRWQWHPEFERASLMQALSAYRSRIQASGSSRR